MKVKNMVNVYIFGKMDQATMEIDKKTEQKDSDFINGRIEQHLQKNGKIII